MDCLVCYNDTQHLVYYIMVKESKKVKSPSNSLLLATFRKIKSSGRSFKTLKLFANKQRPHQKTILLK